MKKLLILMFILSSCNGIKMVKTPNGSVHRYQRSGIEKVKRQQAQYDNYINEAKKQ